MTHSCSAPQQVLFDQFDPLAGLRDLIELPADLQPEATEQWFVTFSPWIHEASRKARLEHSKHISGLHGDTINHIVKKMIIKIITDCQANPDKAQYIGSLEHAVLEEVRKEVASAKGRHGITLSTPKTAVTRGSALNDIRLQLSADLGRAPTRAEVIAEWSQRKADGS